MNLYSWQKQAIATVKNKNAIISAPTGSGKTLVAYHWAGLTEDKLPDERIIFTAPIKALSNERYRELAQKFGAGNVGIETGDIKYNTKARILCVTQEIYTNKYAVIPNQLVVIDEFHYVSQDPQRARSYVEGLFRTNPKSKILCMSATFGDPEQVRGYVSRLMERPVVLYHTDFRPTRLVFLKEPLTLQDLANKNAIVFLFSFRGVNAVAGELAYIKRTLSKQKLSRLKELADHFRVNLNNLPILLKGVGIYHGALLPKEKLLVAELFREGIIDIVVGTDALALGVNFPAEYVVFGQLAKYYDGPISKNEFLQMAGRAGRKGYYDTGYISFIKTPFESFQYSTDDLYERLLSQPQEPFTVSLAPDFEKIVKEIVSPEEEAKLVSLSSIPEGNYEDIYDNIIEGLEAIRVFIEDMAYDFGLTRQKDIENLYSLLQKTYFNEFTIEENLKAFKVIAWAHLSGHQLSISDFLEVTFPGTMCRLQDSVPDGKTLFCLLQVRKFYRRLPEEVKTVFESKFEKKLLSIISAIDHTSINPNIWERAEKESSQDLEECLQVGLSP